MQKNQKPKNPAQQVPLNDLQKKSQLLQQKILTNSSITHNNYQYQISTLHQQQQQLKQQLSSHLAQLSQSLSNSSACFLSSLSMPCLSSLPSSIALSQLKSYLNTQKQTMKSLIQQSEPNAANQPTLHQLVRKKLLQQTLQSIKIKQLQKQIQYLSTHVINSSGLIYVPEGQAGERDEQDRDIDGRIEELIGEIQRLGQMEVVCGVTDGTNRTGVSKQGIVVKGLEMVEKRLEKVYQMLKQQRIQVQQQQKQLQPYNKLSSTTPLYSQQPSKTQCNKPPSGHKISEAELQKIIKIDLQPYTQILSSPTCAHEQLNDNIKILRNRLKKIQ